ncbi:hypothetical protein [Acutalibacter muris]|uniref:hypothetical protein n=1 Tax=Acutalibacter muris TaxID=1796620 RepID=UPI001C3EAF06|nr:hypothetical protein [Acutalibacter muris]
MRILLWPQDNLTHWPQGRHHTFSFRYVNPYCDPHAAWQKGGIERSHEYIRVVLPKGRSFDQLTQEKVTRLMNNINSERRDSLNGHSPFELSILLLPNALHRALGLLPIPPDEVNLSSSLFN